MKKLLGLIFLVLAAGCTSHQQYKRGDCVIAGNYRVYKIKEIGSKNTFLLEDRNGDDVYWNTDIIGGFTSTDCMGEGWRAK